MTTGHQVEVVAAGKSWAASPHLYAYQPAHFHFQEEEFDLGVSVLLNRVSMGLPWKTCFQSLGGNKCS